MLLPFNEEAPKKRIARPGSLTGENSHEMRILSGKIWSHQNTKSLVPKSSRDELFEEVLLKVAWTGPSAVHFATASALSRGLL